MLKLTIHGGQVDEIAAALKCAAEPTRLRLLALLSQGECTVGEICRVLGQSQPRISRHLKVLTEAGFLDRFREQQCVYYRVPVSGRSLGWMRRLLEFVDPADPQLTRDRRQLATMVRERGRAAARSLAATPLIDAQARHLDTLPQELGGALREELGPAAVGELLDVGTGSGEMLQLLGPSAQRAIGIDISTPALRMARSRVHSAGLAHCELQRGDMYALPCADACFDTVSMDRVLAGSERPVAALCEAARALRADGRLVIIEQYEPLVEQGGLDPLSLLRRWLAEAGFRIDRLRPCDPGGAHYIIALARVAPDLRITGDTDR